MANNLFCSVYQKSFSESMRHNELPIWRDSFRINVACKEAIELAIQEGFDGKYLAEDCARRVLDTYGFKRIGYVLANTLQEKSDDGRFSLENKAWSRTIFVPPDSQHNCQFVVDSHPAVLNGFIDQYHREYQKLNLFEEKHCVAKPRAKDFTGKVIVMHPDTLHESFWEPRFQLWYAHDGFGCSPTARGQSVRCTCLADGEMTRWNRSEFIGPINEKYLPDWAKEQLAKLKDGQTISTEDNKEGQVMSV